MPQSENFQFLAVARIVKPQGRRGEVAAEILTDFPERFENLRSAYLEKPGGQPEAVALENAWPHKGRIVLKLLGIDSIDGASGLRGRHVFIRREDRIPLPDHHYYVWELEGCRVLRRPDSREIGIVTGIEPSPGTPLLHVKRTDGRKGESLIPLAQEICNRIDTKARTIWIEPPEDLLELNE